ncbi:hypothetical protein IRJ41_020869, partial [Triplophysa rosa]
EQPDKWNTNKRNGKDCRVTVVALINIAPSVKGIDSSPGTRTHTHTRLDGSPDDQSHRRTGGDLSLFRRVTSECFVSANLMASAGFHGQRRNRNTAHEV